MKIFIDKIIVDKNTFYVLNKIEKGKRILDLIKQGILTFGDSNSLNLPYKKNENQPYLAFIITKMQDNGDYNYDDEWESYYEEEYSYEPIYYCPKTGEKIEFIIENVIDKTLENIQLEKDLKNLLKMRKSKDRDSKEQEIYNKIQKLNSSHFNF